MSFASALATTVLSVVKADARSRRAARLPGRLLRHPPAWDESAAGGCLAVLDDVPATGPLLIDRLAAR
jgi:hypothetical protein